MDSPEEPPPPPQPDYPPCEQIADTGGVCLLPFPRHFTPRGSPFHVATVCYLYISSRANQNVRKKFLALTEKMPALGVRVHLNSSPQLAPLQAVFTDSGQYPKWVHLEPILKGEAARADGYKINVNQDGVVVQANDENGVHYACVTLLQLVEDGPDIPGMEIEDYPLLPYRAVHLDFKGWPPRSTWIKKAIETLSSIKVNLLILEYEAHIDYASTPGLAAEGALSAREIQDLDTYARENGVTLVPLLSCVGNASHVLSKPEYAALREHADYPRMFCIASQDALNFLMAQINDLVPLHSGKMIHIGGDGAFLMGSNPATLARAEEVGGLEAVYLNHVGMLCRFLVSQGVQPLVWDELLRNMTDEQIKWLATDTALIFWLPDGLSPAIAQDVLAHLERYKILGRPAWGSAVLSPGGHFGEFDNIDAWAEVAELNLIGGFVGSIRTRDFAKGGMHPPPEAVWPAIYYAADRAWTGKQTIVRSLFPQRFITRFFGLRDIERQSRLWAGFEHCMTGHPALAHVFFKAEAAREMKNAETAQFMEGFTAMHAFMRIFDEIENEIRCNFVNIQDGTADALQGAQLRWRAQELKTKAPGLIAHFAQAADYLSGEWPVHEYVEAAIAFTLRRLDEIEPLLAAFPLPAAEFRDPIGI